MFSQFLFDKGRDHGAVDAFSDVRVGAQLIGQRPHLANHLLNPLRRPDRIAVFFKPRRLRYVSPALGDQADNLAIQPIDLLAHLLEGITINNHVLKTP